LARVKREPEGNPKDVGMNILVWRGNA